MTADPYSHNDFRRFLVSEFPELRDELDEDSGLLHVQMGALTRLIQRAKGAADWATYTRAVRVVDTLWQRADTDRRNALNVSLLEHLDFAGPRGPEAWRHLTHQLQRAWEAARAYNERATDRAKPARRRR